MERWVEHYSDLYSRETVVTNAALNAIRDLPMMEELDNAKLLTPSLAARHQDVTAYRQK